MTNHKVLYKNKQSYGVVINNFLKLPMQYYAENNARFHQLIWEPPNVRETLIFPSKIQRCMHPIMVLEG